MKGLDESFDIFLDLKGKDINRLAKICSLLLELPRFLCLFVCLLLLFLTTQQPKTYEVMYVDMYYKGR